MSRHELTPMRQTLIVPQHLNHDVARHAHGITDGQRGQGVGHVMHAFHTQIAQLEPGFHPLGQPNIAFLFQ